MLAASKELKDVRTDLNVIRRDGPSAKKADSDHTRQRQQSFSGARVEVDGHAVTVAKTSRSSMLTGVTPGIEGSGYFSASSAASLESKTMTDMPNPSRGSSQYAATMPGARFRRGTLAVCSTFRASSGFSTWTLATTACTARHRIVQIESHPGQLPCISEGRLAITRPAALSAPNSDPGSNTAPSRRSGTGWNIGCEGVCYDSCPNGCSHSAEDSREVVSFRSRQTAWIQAAIAGSETIISICESGEGNRE
jgi:hypothetical protein